MIVIAHRGASDIAPENTLLAFRKARNIGADYVELDVRTTRDGQMVLMHDRSVDRTTNGSGSVRDLTAQQIRSLTIKRTRAEKVPFFEEALDLCKGRAGIYLDLKDAQPAQVVRAIMRRRMERQIAVYAGLGQIRSIKALCPAIRGVAPGNAFFEELKRTGKAPVETADSHIVNWAAEYVEKAHAAGGQVWLDIMGPTDSPAGIRRAVEMGMDGIQTDHCRRALAYLRVMKRMGRE